MTSTSPELLPSAAQRVRHVDPSVAARRAEPSGKSEDRKTKEDKDVQQEKQNTFDLRFSHSCELLHFIARRILNCVQEAEEAVKNCHRTASRNPPGFSSEGAFKSWLVRILIDEATVLLRRKH